MSKKTSKLCVTALCEGNPPVTGGLKGQLSGKSFHLMTSSWIDVQTNNKYKNKAIIVATEYYQDLAYDISYISCIQYVRPIIRFSCFQSTAIVTTQSAYSPPVATVQSKWTKMLKGYHSLFESPLCLAPIWIRPTGGPFLFSTLSASRWPARWGYSDCLFIDDFCRPATWVIGLLCWLCS